MVPEVFPYIRLAQLLAVDKNLAANYFHGITRNADDPLDVRLRSVAREPEHNRVSASDIREPEPVNELVDKNPLLIFEPRHHARAFNLYRLIKKQNHHHREYDAQHQVPKPGKRRSRR